MENKYTYLIGWTQADLWYYGVRYAKDARPSDLWVSYFTSSKNVDSARAFLGEPDIIQIRRTFSSAEQARRWEAKVLRRLHASSDTKWLNRHDGGERFLCVGHSEETRAKLSRALKSRPVTQATRDRIGALNRGKKLSEEVRHKMSKAATGRTPWNAGLTGIYTDAALEKMCKTYEFTSPNGDIVIVNNLKKFCEAHGLAYESMKKVAIGKHIQHRGWKGSPPRDDKTSGEKCWIFFKDGVKVVIHNLKRFCIENELSYRAMKKVGNGEQKEYHGYKLEQESTYA